MTAPSSRRDDLCSDPPRDSADEWPTGSRRAGRAPLLDILEQCKSLPRALRPGEDIFAFGSPCEAVYVLLGGWAYVFRPLEDGQQIILQFVDQGSVIGFHPEPHATAHYSARALSNSIVAVVPYDRLERMFKEEPDVALRLAALLSWDRNSVFDSITSFSRATGRQRVARVLLQFVLRDCAPDQTGPYAKELSIPLTQEHVADATGLSTGHVNRTLGDLRRHGIVEFQYRRLRVINLAKLIEAAGAGAQPASFGPIAKLALSHRP